MSTARFEHFLQAHEAQYATALSEIRAGRKESHWIWFVFPQIAGLGRSLAARSFALSGLDEARAFLADPVLGGHLGEICRALLALDSSDAEAVLGGTDAMKLRSSMTLFHLAAPQEPVFASVLEKFYGGRPDEMTLALLRR